MHLAPRIGVPDLVGAPSPASAPTAQKGPICRKCKKQYPFQLIFGHFWVSVRENGYFYLAILKVPKRRSSLFPKVYAPFYHPDSPEAGEKGVKKVVFSQLLKNAPPAESKSTQVQRFKPIPLRAGNRPFSKIKKKTFWFSPHF